VKVLFDVGRYRVLQRLSAGGMAEVYLGQQKSVEGFEKPVVIKAILPELERDPEFRAMLVNEARLAALLHHINLVQVLDLVFDGERHWVVMEQIEGYTLHALLTIAARQGTTVPPGVVCRIFCSVLSGLSYAHCLEADGRPLGLVHRDISPTNIIIGNSGDARVIDFGIAKATLKMSAQLTQAGQLKGKPSYMSPEQVRSRDSIDARTDVFSVGTVMWEALTTTRLWKRDTPAKSMAAICFDQAPPPSSRVRSLPRELDRILSLALAKDPAQRYLSAQAMREDLEELIVAQKWRASTLDVQRAVDGLLKRGPVGIEDDDDTERGQAPELARSWSDDDYPSVSIDEVLPEVDVIAAAQQSSAQQSSALLSNAPQSTPPASPRPQSRLVLLAWLFLIAAAAAALVLVRG
jgi:serine/threonine-protein kinase